MKTHNRIIYHCLTCGSIVHAENGLRPPICCEYEMVSAAAETVCDPDDTEESATDEFETILPVAGVRPKPR